MTFRCFAAILGKDSFELRAFWPPVPMGTALEALGLEPELRLGTG